MIFFELFYVFFLIGLFTFGGGYAMIPMIQDVVVSKGWITSEALTNFIGISEATPGPFAINIATFIGNQTGGVLGGICATIGVILPSFIIILLIAFLLKKFLKNKFVQGGLNGVKPVVIALILSTAIVFLVKLMLFQGGEIYSVNVTFDKVSIALLLIIVGLLIIYKKKYKKSLNPIILILLCAGLGVVFFDLFRF